MEERRIGRREIGKTSGREGDGSGEGWEDCRLSESRIIGITQILRIEVAWLIFAQLTAHYSFT